MAATNTAALEFARQCAADGDSRADVVAALQDLFGVSRATAYRLAAAAMAAGSAAAESEAIARRDDGTIDVAAEAERQYQAAIEREDDAAQLRWFLLLHKLQS